MNSFKLLIVEDNFNTIEALKIITKDLDNSTSFFASTGNEALKILMNEDINLIFLDLGLPDIQGRHLLRIIKNRKKTSVIPVIITTGVYMSEEDKRKGFEFGASDYIFKPYSKEEIENKILQYMNTYKKIKDLLSEIVKKNEELKNQNRSLKKAYNKIERLITHDSLTNLNSRYYFEKHILNKNLDIKLPLSFIMVSMNNLKIVNDTYGHSKGDELIVEAADYLSHFVQNDDTLIRWIGDEFMIIMPRTDSLQVQDYVSSILKKEFKLKDASITLNLSAGACTLESDEFSLNEVIKVAEDRMYRNKLMNPKSYRSSVIESLKKTLFEKDFETENHTERVAAITMELASVMNMTVAEKNEIYLLATLHDIGKIGIPDKILMKPGKLNNEEWELIKKHPEVGSDICKTIPELSGIAEYILSHHEWWNGEGYPRGLKHDEIPILSRILSIADAYDVMTEGRPYKKPISDKEAKEELKKCAGNQFDPELVEIFIDCCG